VVACNAENNIPIVGKHEVARFHDMHWLRIDRYFSGNPNDADSIQTVFMPMLCQHCDNAPCENVCPVAATNHSSEGINQMTYNRCIGTRYCANNCPYKVRRFNWADYTGADSFKDNQRPLVEEGQLDDVVLMMNDELTRMVLNPDVTVRSRGVIEKCSFCVQRLQEGKLKAKKAGRELEDSDVKTACQQACAADAIVFGNANNPQSEVSKVRKENGLRLYHALEQIHVMPNINYLAKVRNSHDIANAGRLSAEVFTHQKETPGVAGEHQEKAH
jgi:molybdopterin-containing oxidoreductase family iron-sulfur binding subunit